ncbi:MAG: hypothetical protein ACFE8L_07420 [Candidatus Hodarchaeota archaeon]
MTKSTAILKSSLFFQLSPLNNSTGNVLKINSPVVFRRKPIKASPTKSPVPASSISIEIFYHPLVYLIPYLIV